MIRNKLTLEQRINRLEKFITNKFEAVNSYGHFTRTDVKPFIDALNNRDDILVLDYDTPVNSDTWKVTISNIDGTDKTFFDVYMMSDGTVTVWDGNHAFNPINSKRFRSVTSCANRLVPYKR